MQHDINITTGEILLQIYITYIDIFYSIIFILIMYYGLYIPV